MTALSIVASFHAALLAADVIRVDRGVIISNWDAGSADDDMALEFSVTDDDATIDCELTNAMIEETGEWVGDAFHVIDGNGDRTVLQFYKLHDCGAEHFSPSGKNIPHSLSEILLQGDSWGYTIVLDGAGGARQIGGILTNKEGECAEYVAAIDAIESMVLAHAAAGVPVAQPAYIRGIDAAIEACENNL